MINQCALCGKFKKWKDLVSEYGDSDDLGNYEEWFECVDCTPKEINNGNV